MGQGSPMRGMVLFSNFGHLYTHLVLLLYPTVVLALEHEFALSYGELMALSVPGFILVGAGALPAGWLSDRWSATRMMAIFFFGLGAGCLLTGLATTPLAVAAGLGVIGLFASIYHPVGISLLVRTAENRGRALGINGVYGGIGMAAAGFVAGGLTDGLGWRWAFFVPGAVFAATGVLYVFLARRPRVAVAEAKPHVEAPISRNDAMRGMIVLMVAILGTGLIYNMTSVALPKVFSERAAGWFGSSEAFNAGALFSVVYGVGAAMQIVGGWLADKFPLKRIYVIAYLIQVPVILLAAEMTDLPLVAVAAIMVSMNMGMQATENLLVARYSPAKWKATAFGAKFVVSLGASSLAVPIVAFIRDGTGGFTWLFLSLSMIAAGVAVAGMVLPGTRRETMSAPVAVPAE